MARTGQPSRERVGLGVAGTRGARPPRRDGPLGTNEIARRTGTTPSTVSRHLGTLVEASLVEHDAASGQYRLGLRLVRLASAVLARLDVREHRAPPPRGARRCDRRDDDALRPGRAGRDHGRLRGEPSLRPRRDAARPPSVAHATAAGKVMLAFSEPHCRPRRSSPSPSARSPTRPRSKPSSARIRKAGWAEAYEEREPELNAIAAPVWSAPGELAAIVAVQGPIPRFGRARRTQGGARAARPLGRDLGRARLQYEPLTPGIQLVPASGTRAIAAASTVSATRSSGSRLWTCDLPHARASVCVSSVSTRR